MRDRIIFFGGILGILLLTMILGDYIIFTSESEEHIGDPYRKQGQDTVMLTSPSSGWRNLEEEFYVIEEVLGTGSRVHVNYTSSDYEINCGIFISKDASRTITASNFYSNYVELLHSSGSKMHGELFFDVVAHNIYYISFHLDGFGLAYEEYGLNSSLVFKSYETTVDFSLELDIQDSQIITTNRTPLKSPVVPLLIIGVLAIAVIDLGLTQKKKRTLDTVSAFGSNLAIPKVNREGNTSKAPERNIPIDSQARKQLQCPNCFQDLKKSEIFCSNCGHKLI